MASICFDFPEWHLNVAAEKPAGAGTAEPADWEADLADLDESDVSGGAEDQVTDTLAQPMPHTAPADLSSEYGHFREAHVAAPSAAEIEPASGAAADGVLGAMPHSDSSPAKRATAQYDLPPEVVAHILSHLQFRDCIRASITCKDWHQAVAAANELWQAFGVERYSDGWPLQPHRGARLLQLPPGAASTAPLQFKAVTLATGVGVRFMCLRKGYEYLLAGFHALWEGVQSAAAAAHAAGARPLAQRITHVDELWRPARDSTSAVQVPDMYSGGAMRRMVDKLAGSNWQLMYEGLSVAFTVIADGVAAALRRGCSAAAASQQQQRPQHAVDASPTGIDASCVGWLGAAGVGCGSGARGGSTRLLQRYNAADVNGMVLLPEMDVLQAADGQGSKPAAGIALWQQLLPQWEAYRRWLDLVIARCGLLGARVEAARQLLPPGPPQSTAASIPHLLNKGLLVFRSQVLLAYGLRRPLMQAGLWLAAAADVDAEEWRSGGGLSDPELALLVRLRKMLTELDVYDDGTQLSGTHTLAKFRRCFGPLLLTDRRAEKLGLRGR